ncbi:MAG: hypothetical protein JW702_09015 [Clostridiales bacterium]|nr:hypothetical protein [Clostridiales bacterium]
MGKKSVVSIGADIPGAEFDNISLKSRASLLDYDVVIIDPAIYGFYGYRYEDYLGKPCLDDSNSFSLKEHLEHWRREILESIRAWKNVFIMLNQEQEVYIATGTKSYSGTGRNRQTTRHVDLTSNYRIIPGSINVTNSKGSLMVLVGNDNVLATYWSVIGSLSEFRVLLDGEGVKPIVQTKTGKKTVGARIRYKNAEGNLFLLPYVNFELDKYTYENEEDGKIYWTDEAVALGKRFVTSICELDNSVKSTGTLSAKPDWLTQDKYVLPKEEKIVSKLIDLEKKLDALHKKKEQFEQEIVDESLLKRLLFENGKPLEKAIYIALELMGFSVSHYEDPESEFDVVFESEEGRLIGEVEGKDNKSINIDKLRQLEMNIHEDFARDEVENMAKGALFGNAFRLIEPSERGDFFTEKCITAANRSGTALISTVDLFYVAKYLSGKTDKKFAKKCRKSIIGTTGVVMLPEVPITGEGIEVLSEDQKNE